MKAATPLLGPGPDVSTKTRPSRWTGEFFETSTISNCSKGPNRVEEYNKELEKREKASQQRIEELRSTLYERDMKECTFRPTVRSPTYVLFHYYYLTEHT